MIKINLLPKEIEKKTTKEAQNVWMVLLVILVVLLIGILYGWRIIQSQQLRSKRSKIQQELDRLQATVSQVEALERQRVMLNKKLDVIGTLIKGRLVYPQFMENLSNKLPKSVWIESLNTVNKGKGSIAINISGVSFTNFGIADFIDMFEKDEKFAEHIGEIKLGSIHSTKVEETDAFSFSLSGDYKYKE